MPAYFFTTDPYIYGRIMANFTSGHPVRGNLTLKATIRPIGYFNNQVLNEKYRLGRSPFELAQIYREQQYRNSYNYNNLNPNYNTGGGVVLPEGPDDRTQNTLYPNQYVIEQNYHFDEEWPFWVRKPEEQQSYDPWTSSYRNTLPFLRYFNGTFNFKWPMRELELLVPNLAGKFRKKINLISYNFLNSITELCHNQKHSLLFI